MMVVIDKNTMGLKPMFDRYTFKEEDSYYVKIDSESYDELWNGKYRYTFSGYNDEGEHQEVVKLMDRKLRDGAYIDIVSGGSHGQGWTEIEESEVPDGVLYLMEKEK